MQLLHISESSRQYLFYRVLQLLAAYATWIYYNTLLLRTTENDITVVFVNYVIMHTGMIVGFCCGSVLIGKFGYLHSYRWSSVLRLVSIVFAGLTLSEIAITYPITTLLFGIGNGWFWVAVNNYSQRDLHAHERGEALSFIVAIELAVEVFASLIMGFAISQIGYGVLFLVGTAIWLFGVFYPWRENFKTESTINWTDLRRIFHRRGFWKWSSVILLDSITGNLREIALLLLPFLFIGTEFGLGIFTAVVGLAAAVMALWHRHAEMRKKVEWGFVGAGVIAGANIMLLIFWNLPALVVRSLLQRAGYSLHVPVNAELEFRNGELFLGSFLGEGTAELMLYREWILFLGRMLSGAAIIVCLALFKVPADGLLKFIVLLTAVREITMLAGQLWLQTVLKK